MALSGTEIDGSGVVDDSLAYIQIDYKPDSEDPARVFRAMAKLIDAFYEIDRDLSHAITASIEPVLILDRIEAGSIRAWLKTILREIDDEALRTLDWKPLVGQYLVRGKHTLIRWLDAKERLESRADVSQLQSELLQLAPEMAGPEGLLATPVPAARLLVGVQLISEALRDLQAGDSVLYVSAGDSTPVTSSLDLSDEDIEHLLTDEVIESVGELVLLVKKPDYLGQSKWEFKHEDRAIDAKMLDEAWLTRFRRGSIPLRPGDSLRAVVRSALYRGFEGNLVTTRHFVIQVLDVVRDDEQPQIPLIR